MIAITLSNVTVMVQNMDASIRFYESIGFKLKQRWDNHYAMIEAAGLILGLHPSTGKPDPGNQVSFGFMVPKALDAKEELDKLGVSCTLESGKSGVYVHFKDPDGVSLYFTEPQS